MGLDRGGYYTVSKDAPIGLYMGTSAVENSHFPGLSAETRAWNMMGAVLCEATARHTADGGTEAVRF